MDQTGYTVYTYYLHTIYPSPTHTSHTHTMDLHITLKTRSCTKFFELCSNCFLAYVANICDYWVLQQEGEVLQLWSVDWKVPRQ